MDIVELSNQEDSKNFSVGMVTPVFVDAPKRRWWSRLWRWAWCIKDPTPSTMVITNVDEQSGTITLCSED
jgi:hypothetical protein